MDAAHVATLLDAVEFRLEWLDDYGVREYGVNAEAVRLKYEQAADALRRDALHTSDLVSREDLAYVAESLDILASLDEGEHTDRDRLVRLAAVLGAAAGLTPQPAPKTAAQLARAAIESLTREERSPSTVDLLTLQGIDADDEPRHFDEDEKVDAVEVILRRYLD